VWKSIVPERVESGETFLSRMSTTTGSALHLSFYGASVAQGEKWSQVSQDPTTRSDCGSRSSAAGAPPRGVYPVRNLFLRPEPRDRLRMADAACAQSNDVYQVHSIMCSGCCWRTVVAAGRSRSDQPVRTRSGQMLLTNPVWIFGRSAPPADRDRRA
jgi:hypothetical protein